MLDQGIERMPRAAVALLSVVVLLMLLQLGLVLSQALADIGGGTPSSSVIPDPVSDGVGATAAEFRVDESGAATYSIPLYGVPGTAGVSPKLSLNYSSQGGYGPLGKGWSIGGLSSITRCRATREAGDFISGGVPIDGSPAPINFTATDRYCLDGQRLIPAQSGTATCPAVTGMTAVNLRTEIESFQRVCAYTPSSGASGVAFFTVERKDGSTSWYGDRVVSASQDLGYKGYVNSTAPGKTAFAVSWAQTRFQDSTGNYIDYRYLQWASDGEHLISEVRYTGKNVLTGQSGSAQTTYARFIFNYVPRPATQWAIGYVSGGRVRQSYRLDSISSLGDADAQARHYRLTYATSVSGSGLETLANLKECRDSSLGATCLSPTTFEWSQAKHELLNGVSWEPSTFDTDKFEGFKLGDIDGDGRQDMVWLRDGPNGLNLCNTEDVLVSWGLVGANGVSSFAETTFGGCTDTEMPKGDSGAWQLFDYNGDGRDDLFILGNPGNGSAWQIHPSQGRVHNAFNTSVNLIASTAFIPANYNYGPHPQLTDLNGDGQLDVVVSDGYQGLSAYITQRGSQGFGWGPGAPLQITSAALPEERVCNGEPCYLRTVELQHPSGNYQLLDFDGDGRSDLMLNAKYEIPDPFCEVGMSANLAMETDGAAQLPTEEDPNLLPPGEKCYPEKFSFSFAMKVVSQTATQIQIEPYTDFAGIAKGRYADFNGDGLTDTLGTINGSWQVHYNTGTGFSAPVVVGTLPSSNKMFTQDVTGDGRADILYLNGTSYSMRPALPDGSFGPAQSVPGQGAFACIGAGCDPNTYVNIFSDFDADGAVDYFAFNLSQNPVFYVSQSATADRGKPRDIITAIQNGLGARTELAYASLTNGAIHRRDAGSRDGVAAAWGRGSPVQDFIAPMYVVAKASSSAPTAANAGAMASLYYRYAGAKVQAGGRGFLGFKEISTIDPNQSGGHVVTTTYYSQEFPFIGMPWRTVKSVIDGTYTSSACLTAPIQNACYALPGQASPDFGGRTFSNNWQTWDDDTEVASETVSAFAAGMQAPVHVRVLGTDEMLHDPNTGEMTSRVVTTFTYGANGNAIGTSVDTYSGQSTLTATLITSNVYAADNPTKWRLGRLTASTITHKRPNRADVVRSSAFEYAMSGAVTGLLTAEVTQPNGNDAEKLRKEYNYDAFGNRTSTETCAAPAISCSSAISFHPATLTAIQRYSRTTYDSAGRYPVATYEPFWNGAGATEQITQTVVGRNLFGDATQAYDLNGADALSIPGAFGRPYYSWVEVIAGSVPGTASGGVESFTSYRWCGSGGVDCPQGAKFRQKVVTEGAPTQWTYFDVLGRPIMKAAQTFNLNVVDADVSAVCTDYDATGKQRRVSNPFFLTGTPADGPIGVANECVSLERQWTTTTSDILGRPVTVTSPKVGGGVSTITTTYNGRQTTVTNPRSASFTTTRIVNGKGELSQVIDANGLITTYWYLADGSNYLVSRDAGRGLVENFFWFDDLGRKTRQLDPDSGDTRFEYNALGELVAQVDADGNRIENKIDARGRVWQRTVKLADASVESESTFNFDTAANGLGKLAGETIAGIYAPWRPVPTMAFAYTRGYAYDTLGRPSATTTVIDGTSYPGAVAYDGLGRPFRSQDASGLWSKTEINARGFASALCTSHATDNAAACATSLQRTQAMDAWGHVTAEVRSPTGQLPVTRSYWQETGRIAQICADKPGAGTGCDLVDEQYAWDHAGNLSTRLKDTRYLEAFYYDSLDRLTLGYITKRNGVATNLLTHWTVYDPLGNVCAKLIDGLGTALGYEGRAGCGAGAPGSTEPMYGSGGSGPVGPHRVSRIEGGPHDAYLYYDARGNQTFRDASNNAKDRTIRYSADNRPYVIIDGVWGTTTEVARYWYGPDGQRYKRENIANNKFTYYLGNVEVIKQGGVTTFKRNIGGVVLQTIVGGSSTDHYLFHDQLGSVVRITDAAGNNVEQLDYNTVGERRSISDPLQTYEGSPALTERGFTGHEHVEGDVIHMNGRVYDPVLSRFLQPDPLIQAPGNAQSWNAYTYVFNNPLSYTDPTGLWGKKEQNALRMVAAAVISIWTGGAAYGMVANGAMGAAFATAMLGGFAAGVISSNGSIRSGLIGAFGAGMALGISSFGLGYLGNAIAQGLSGGIMESLQGGNFGNGFIAAGLTAAVMPQVGQIRNDVARTAVGALVGGTISDATGGKFANGAVSGAIQGAMAGRRSAEPAANNVEGRSKTYGPRTKSLVPPGERQAYLRKVMVENGMAGAENTYYSDTIPLMACVDQGAPMCSMGGYIFAGADAFEYSVGDVGSMLYHESVHVEQFRRGGVWADSQSKLMQETKQLEAYSRQMSSQNPFFNSMTPDSHNGWSAARDQHYGNVMRMLKD